LWEINLEFNCMAFQLAKMIAIFKQCRIAYYRVTPTLFTFSFKFNLPIGCHSATCRKWVLRDGDREIPLNKQSTITLQNGTTKQCSSGYNLSFKPNPPWDIPNTQITVDGQLEGIDACSYNLDLEIVSEQYSSSICNETRQLVPHKNKWQKLLYNKMLWSLVIFIMYWSMTSNPEVSIPLTNFALPIPSLTGIMKANYPTPTPKDLVGIWFAQLTNDDKQSNRTGITSRLKQELNSIPDLRNKFEVRNLEKNIECERDEMCHEIARNYGLKHNAAIVVWGNIGEISDQSVINLYLTFTKPLENFGIAIEQGPIPIGFKRTGLRSVIEPDEAAAQWTRFTKLILAYSEHEARNRIQSTRLFEELIPEFHDNKDIVADLHYYAGFGHMMLWRADKSMTHFSKAKEHYEYAATHCRDCQSPKSGLCLNAKFNIAVLYWLAGDNQAAVKIYREALKIESPDKHVVWNNLGATYLNMGDSKNAEFAYRNCINMNSGLIMCNMALGNLLMNQGKYSEAESVFRAATLIKPQDPRPWFQLGQCLLKQGLIDKGNVCIKTAIKLDPEQEHIKPVKKVLRNQSESTTISDIQPLF